ncbi:hypothetical protein FBUS_04740 [Fasciolopsis buskii]|uniref:Uncharacterized protein n=1 Tax=Fasciolopsis buskii TaxID=27845 RepID=A0A8E0RPD3_9TREM|nr:hypothetical protein FBUS_04740 [Fasciolopsis buski]
MQDRSDDDEEDMEIKTITQLNSDTFKDSPYQIKARDVAYFDFHCVEEDPEICYFTFPIDMKALEVYPVEFICLFFMAKGLSVLQFLSRYCIICPRRRRLYDRVFHKWSHGSTMPSKNIFLALCDIVVCDVPAGSDQVIYDLAGMDSSTNQELTKDLFCWLCALAERAIFAKMLKDENIPVSPKHFLELAEIHRYRQDYVNLKLDAKLDVFINLISL